MSRNKINSDAWKMSNGGQFTENYQKWLAANLFPAYSPNNVYLDTQPASKTKLDYSDAGSTAGGVFGQIFGGPAGGALGSMIGNAAGQGLNYVANKSLQENQQSNQQELQTRAFNLNQRAVQNQAQNEVIGMQNAGLNPASVNGQGAPSLQAGAAAGATSTMSNIFGGLAELIAAIKAPTEIEKLQAEKMLTEGQTEKVAADTDLTHEQKYNLMLDSDLIKPAQANELNAMAQKAIADAAKATAEGEYTGKLFDMLQNQDDFIRQYSQSIYSSYMDNLKSVGQWDKLPKNTKETVEKLASGEIDIGLGELKGLNDIIDSQTNLLQRDRDGLKAMLDTIVTREQIDDKQVIAAFRKLPENQRKLMMSEITNYYAQAKNAKANASRTGTLEWLDQMTSDDWLIQHGMTDEIERKKYKEVLNNLMKLTDPATYTGVGGGLVGHAIVSRDVKPRPLDKPDHGSKRSPFFIGGLGDYQANQYNYHHH